MVQPAPIVIFVYNRPEHTQCALEYLSRNEKANSSKLYICCDGPKPTASSEEKEKIEQVRRVVRMKSWCKENIIVEETFNKGIYTSMTTVITELVNRYGSLIILEDDIVTSKWFLDFMNAALHKYEKDNEVMSVNGFSFPLKKINAGSYFLHSGPGWGWGTWKRAWSQFNPDSGYLLAELEKRKLVSAYNVNDTYNYYSILKAHHDGTLTAWDACWYATIVLAGGLTIYPGQSLTKNIGMDGSGTHYSGSSDKKGIDMNAFKEWSEKLNKPSLPLAVKENKSAQHALENYFRMQAGNSLIARIRRKISKHFFTLS